MCPRSAYASAPWGPSTPIKKRGHLTGLKAKGWLLPPPILMNNHNSWHSCSIDCVPGTVFCIHYPLSICQSSKGIVQRKKSRLGEGNLLPHSNTQKCHHPAFSVSSKTLRDDGCSPGRVPEEPRLPSSPYEGRPPQLSSLLHPSIKPSLPLRGS